MKVDLLRMCFLARGASVLYSTQLKQPGRLGIIPVSKDPNGGLRIA